VILIVDPNLGLNRGQFFAPPGIGWTDGEIRPWIVTEFKKRKILMVLMIFV